MGNTVAIILIGLLVAFIVYNGVKLVQQIIKIRTKKQELPQEVTSEVVQSGREEEQEQQDET